MYRVVHSESLLNFMCLLIFVLIALKVTTFAHLVLPKHPKHAIQLIFVAIFFYCFWKILIFFFLILCINEKIFKKNQLKINDWNTLNSQLAKWLYFKPIIPIHDKNQCKSTRSIRKCNFLMKTYWIII